MKNVVAQRRVEPGIDRAHGVFDAGFVLGSGRASSFNVEFVVLAELHNNVVKIRLVAMGFDDERLEIIRDDGLR